MSKSKYCFVTLADLISRFKDDAQIKVCIKWADIQGIPNIPIALEHSKLNAAKPISTKNIPLIEEKKVNIKETVLEPL